jgi:hypothetical protein
LFLFHGHVLSPSKQSTPDSDPVGRLISMNSLKFPQWMSVIQRTECSPLQFIVISSKNVEQGAPQFLAVLLPTYNLSKLFESKDEWCQECLIRMILKQGLPVFSSLPQDDLVVSVLECITNQRDFCSQSCEDCGDLCCPS